MVGYIKKKKRNIHSFMLLSFFLFCQIIISNLSIRQFCRWQPSSVVVELWQWKAKKNEKEFIVKISATIVYIYIYMCVYQWKLSWIWILIEWQNKSSLMKYISAMNFKTHYIIDDFFSLKEKRYMIKEKGFNYIK